MRGAVPRRTSDARWSVQERLAQSRSLHRIAGEVGRIGGWVLDLRARELTWSDEVFALLEYPADRAAPVDALATCLPADRERLALAVDRCATEGTPFDLDIEVETRTGRRLRARVVAEPRRDEHGEIAQVIGTFQDTSEMVAAREAAREALRRREIELADQAALLDEATDAIVVRDLDHRLTYWNRSAERLYGWRAEEVLGRSVRDLLHAGDPTAFDAAYRELLLEDAWAGVLTPRRRSGEEVVIEARWSLVRDASGAPRSVLAIATDVTEQRRMEHQLIRAQRLQAVGTLAGGLAHDLRNVLTPVMMSLELLREGETDPLRRELLETVERNTRRASDIVSQVLSFARGLDGQRVEVHVRQLLHELARFVQQTFPPDFELSLVTSPDVRAVRGDPTQVHQVLVNLLLNARDAMPDGGRVEVRADDVRIEEGDGRGDHPLPPGSYVRIEVTDTGVGMPRDVADRIFEPFFTTKRGGDGTGLGLSTVLAIVQSHGGDVAVDSTVGTGTRFTIHLPAAATPAPTAAPLAPPATGDGGGEVILLVDDEPLVRRLTKRTLERAGYQVVEADDGTAALAAFAEDEDRFDLLVTDLSMPRIGGRELVATVRARRPDLPVVVSSGLPPSHAGPAMARSTWLAKPFTVADLLRQVRTALGEDADPAAARQADSEEATRR